MIQLAETLGELIYDHGGEFGTYDELADHLRHAHGRRFRNSTFSKLYGMYGPTRVVSSYSQRERDRQPGDTVW
jgi:hypothetical protein